MEMLLGSMVGGGASLAGGIMNANAQEKANNQNWMINLLNYYQRQKEHNQAIQMAERNREEGQLGSTDAYGNRIHFVPGRGWVTELSAEGRGLHDAQTREQMAVLGQDLPLRRQQMYRNNQRQQQEGLYADNLMRHFGDREVNPDDLRHMMMMEAEKGTNREYDALTQSAMRKAIRGHSSNTGSILRAMNKGRAEAAGTARSGMAMQAMNMANQMNTGAQDRLFNLYNAMAGRASGLPQAKYTPIEDPASKQSNALLTSIMKNQQGYNLDATDRYGRNAGSIDYVQPNLGYGNAIAGAGGIFGSGISGMGAQGRRNQFYDEQRSIGNETEY